VDDLLDVSRISRGRLKLRKERIDLAAVVQAAVETCKSLIDEADDELTLTLPEELIYVDGDKTRLTQVVCNLLNNAVKFSERESSISLSVEREGQEALIRVKDNGMGISSAMLPRVFEMFVQGDRPLEKTPGGLGVGLSIVKQIVEMHDGQIEARSEGIGHGSEFIIRLPVLQTNESRSQDEK
jgi:signal transduction histidine kinase